MKGAEGAGSARNDGRGGGRPAASELIAASDAIDNPDAYEDVEADSTVETVAEPEVMRRPRRAPRYQVVMHNDDYTTMEFVVAMLMKHFHKPPAEALHVMLLVHHKGAGIAGVYTHDVAETKVAEVTDEARQEGMPLLLTVEPRAFDDPDDPDDPHDPHDPGDPEDADGPAGRGGPR